MDCIVQVLWLLLLLMMWRDAEIQSVNICQKYIYIYIRWNDDPNIRRINRSICWNMKIVFGGNLSIRLSKFQLTWSGWRSSLRQERSWSSNVCFLFGNPVNFKASSAFCNIGMILTLKVRWAVEGGSAGEWHKPGGRIRRMVVGLVDRMDMDGCNLMLRMKTGRSLCFRYLCLVLNWPKEMFWLERLNKVGCNKVTSDCSYGRSTF